MHSDSITCMDCEHDLSDHHRDNRDSGCTVAGCICTETQADLIELTYPEDTP